MGSAWKAREIRKPEWKISQSQAERLNRNRELREIREKHRRLRAEFLERDERRRAA
jgi:hypothetical protein